MKTFFAKFLLVTMALGLTFSSTLFKPSAASAAAPEVIDLDQTQVDQEIDLSKLKDTGPQALPPRTKAQSALYVVLLAYVGVAMANIVIENAINNGIKSACKKFDDNWGVRQACKVVKP
jgi:hypothetical protein